MPEKEEQLEDGIWKKFLRKRWKMSILIVIGIVVAAIGAFLVFLRFADDAQATTLAPATLGNWSVGTAVAFMLRLIFWEFIIIGIPVIAVAIVIYSQWWLFLPEEEREEYKGEPKKRGLRTGTTAGSGGGFFSFLTWIAWLVIVYTQGKWDLELQLWTFNDLISTWIWALIGILIICGFPMALFVIYWLRRELKEES